MKTDHHFLNNLEHSHYVASIVAARMREWGYQVKQKPYIPPDVERAYREKTGQRSDWHDGGDLEIKQRMEVKQRLFHFECAYDYPYDTVYVDEKYKLDRIPSAHLWGNVITNLSISHVCLILAHTRRFWVVEKKWDNKDGRLCDFYACPKEHGVFIAWRTPP